MKIYRMPSQRKLETLLEFPKEEKVKKSEYQNLDE